MHPKSKKLLEDVIASCDYIAEDTRGATLQTWLQQRQMRQATERNFEIIGEALVRLRDIDPETSRRISRVHRIIGLRNRLAHGYDTEIDDVLLWQVVQGSVPVLRGEVSGLLRDGSA